MLSERVNGGLVLSCPEVARTFSSFLFRRSHRVKQWKVQCNQTRIVFSSIKCRLRQRILIFGPETLHFALHLNLPRWRFEYFEYHCNTVCTSTAVLASSISMKRRHIIFGHSSYKKLNVWINKNNNVVWSFPHVQNILYSHNITWAYPRWCRPCSTTIGKPG